MDYVEQESKRGVSEFTIKKVLRNAGWDEVSIEEAFAAIQGRVAPPLPKAQAAKNEYVPRNNDDVAPLSQKSSHGPILIVSAVVLVAALAAVVALWFLNSRPSDLKESQLVSDDNSSTIVEETEDMPQPEEPAVSVNATTTGSGNDAETFGTSTVPTMVPEANSGVATSTVALAAEATARDNQRMADMQKMGEAQKNLYEANKAYYTCGLSGGDCKGKPYGYPLQLGTIDKTPQDPLIGAKPVCGKDYVYCGLNNAPYPQFFCYYAKLESGGYYTASHAGNFYRSTLPKIFEECSVAN